MEGQEDEPDQEPPMKVMREHRDKDFVIKHGKELQDILTDYRRQIDELEYTCDHYRNEHERLKLELKNFKQVREALRDIEKWLDVNDYAWDWSLDMILLGYYMRTQYNACWNTIKNEWSVV